jgi:hypothetical protein
MIPLSENLVPIHDYELSLGNEVLRRDEQMWSKCPLAVIFKYPLHFEEIEHSLTLPAAVERWENRDGHYDLEAVFVCKETGHSLSGLVPQPDP